MTKAEAVPDIDVRKVMELLPHRYPFLLVDRVVELVPDSHIEALKNVTINEPFFQGHFPGLPVMPGVLQLEALAQASGVFILTSYPEEYMGKVFLFSGINKVRFRRPVVPGDALILRCEDFKAKMSVVRMQCRAMVEGKVTVEAQLSGAFVPEEEL